MRCKHWTTIANMKEDSVIAMCEMILEIMDPESSETKRKPMALLKI